MVGDFITDAGSWETARLYLNTTLFFMFDVPTVLADAAVLFHPRKPVQHYCAFKGQGHRAIIVGWPSKAQAEYENRCGSLSHVPRLLLGTLPLLLLQSFIIYTQDGFSISLGSTFAVSMACFGLKLRSICSLLRNRRNFFNAMRRQTASPDSREREVAYRLLGQHFGEEPPADVRERARSKHGLSDFVDEPASEMAVSEGSGSESDFHCPPPSRWECSWA